MSKTAIIPNCSLKELNTWRCGGKCRWLASPAFADEAVELIKQANDAGTKLYALGGGSNILVSDGMLDAGVISTSALNTLELYEENGAVFANVGSGVRVGKMLALALQKNFDGLAFLTGIPGTVGGAICGNAGAAGESFAPLIEVIEGVTSSGEIKKWYKNDLKWEYRSSPWRDDVPLLVTKAQMRLSYTTKDNIIKNIRRFAALKKGQPLGARTAGCVFKNPPGSSAGLLIDKCGCKGVSIGDARVSVRHANFIENCGAARSEDIFKLCEMCRMRVYEKFGIELEYEIKFFGAFQTPQKI